MTQTAASRGKCRRSDFDGRRFPLATNNRFQLGGIAVTMMVLLRIAVGAHFLYQGLAKYENPNFSAKAFLSQAKGPSADFFHGLIPDYDGRERLGIPEATGEDDKPKRGQAIIDRWAEHRDGVVAFYQFNDEDRTKVDEVLASHQRNLEGYLKSNEQDIAGYFFDLDKLAEDKRDPNFKDVPYQRQRLWERSQELRSTAGVWLSKIDNMTESLLDDLNALAKDDRRDWAGGRYEEPIGRMQLLDNVIMVSNMVIGVCLIAGLFTRLASFSGAVFLLSIVLSQPAWPTIYPPPPLVVGKSLIVTKEFIEMMAMFVLAATHVGRWGGLDFFVHHCLVRPIFGKKETS